MNSPFKKIAHKELDGQKGEGGETAIEAVDEIAKGLAEEQIRDEEEAEGEDEDEEVGSDCESEEELVGEVEGEGQIELAEEDIGEVRDVGLEEGLDHDALEEEVAPEEDAHFVVEETEEDPLQDQAQEDGLQD